MTESEALVRVADAHLQLPLTDASLLNSNEDFILGTQLSPKEKPGRTDILSLRENRRMKRRASTKNPAPAPAPVLPTSSLPLKKRGSESPTSKSPSNVVLEEKQVQIDTLNVDTVMTDAMNDLDNCDTEDDVGDQEIVPELPEVSIPDPDPEPEPKPVVAVKEDDGNELVNLMMPRAVPKKRRHRSHSKHKRREKSRKVEPEPVPVPVPEPESEPEPTPATDERVKLTVQPVVDNEFNVLKAMIKPSAFWSEHKAFLTVCQKKWIALQRTTFVDGSEKLQAEDFDRMLRFVLYWAVNMLLPSPGERIEKFAAKLKEIDADSAFLLEERCARKVYCDEIQSVSGQFADLEKKYPKLEKNPCFVDIWKMAFTCVMFDYFETECKIPADETYHCAVTGEPVVDGENVYVFAFLPTQILGNWNENESDENSEKWDANVNTLQFYIKKHPDRQNEKFYLDQILTFFNFACWEQKLIVHIEHWDHAKHGSHHDTRPEAKLEAFMKEWRETVVSMVLDFFKLKTFVTKYFNRG